MSEKSNKELIAEAISKLSDEQKALMYPPLVRKNFVVRKSWIGRNQVITFDTKATTTKPSVRVTYDHDEVLTAMLPRLTILVTIHRYAFNCEAPRQKRINRLTIKTGGTTPSVFYFFYYAIQSEKRKRAGYVEKKIIYLKFNSNN